ncbi:hypothetical protein PITC_051770 [Penicillium italicum]|uniref:Major facilitator superfamily domain, general substrate transporter n=1 Tax=Penicillium italicum TaxID=40296 RepID=A0A0A2KXB2_PENIT|nr:hypothetical protein PITC_051770 [Penicillium italicum]
MIEAFGVVCTVWVGSILSLGVAVTGSFYLLAVDGSTTLPHGSENLHSAYSARQFPRNFWQLALICILGYGGINTFTISAQRFLAAWFYDGDQRKAGATIGQVDIHRCCPKLTFDCRIPYFLSGVLTLPFGLLLNLPWFQSYPGCLGATNILMIAAHLLLLYRIEPVGSMCLLGIAYALYGVAFWAGLARCLLSVVESKTDVSDIQERSSEENEYGTIRIQTQLSDGENEEQWETAGDGIITLGYGIMTSLNNLSTAVVPIFLAKTENAFGFIGLEFFFLTLSLLGLFVSGGLLWSWRT